MWKECYKDLESTKQCSVWIDKLGKENSIKQIKDKLQNREDLYKPAKDNNKKTGSSPMFSPYYQDFDKILGTRDISSLQHRTGLALERRFQILKPIMRILEVIYTCFFYYSYLSVKRTFLSSTFSCYFLFFIQVL